MSCRITKSDLIELYSSDNNNRLKYSQSSNVTAEGLEFDSRLIKGGEIFIALKGLVSHGHEFVDLAFERGAALLIVEDEKFLQSEFKDHVIVVADTQKALWQLASHWRKKLNLPTIAVTGSVGKTTTKEIIASLLVQSGPGCYAQKSFNNHVGVPYTILKSSTSHQWMVIEIGMNAPGEIASLSKIAEPDVCVITEVAAAHIQAFNSIEDIAKEKLSIIEGAKENADIVVNGDNPFLRKIISENKTDKNLKYTFVGLNSGNDIVIDRVESFGTEKITFRIQKDFTAELSTCGAHNALNGSLAYVAVTKLMPSMARSQLEDGFKKFISPLMRLNLKYTKKGISLLDDSYNANPASMKAMLSIAADVKKEGKKIMLILGTMRELGRFGKQYHNELGEQINELKPDSVILVGEHSEDVRSSIANLDDISVIIANNPEEAAKVATTTDTDMIFVKGSRGIELDRAVSLLVS